MGVCDIDDIEQSRIFIDEYGTSKQFKKTRLSNFEKESVIRFYLVILSNILGMMQESMYQVQLCSKGIEKEVTKAFNIAV